MNENITSAFLEYNAIFEDLTISDINMQEAKLHSKHFIECNFNNCDFNESLFTHCSFSNCTFTSCNLTLIKLLDCQIEKSQFLQCKMIGIDWTQAIWNKQVSKKKNSFTLEFKECILNYSTFIGLNLYKASFIGCTLKDVGFENADIQDGDFTNSDLTGALFNDTNLSGADFSLAKNYTINVCHNNITKAKFSMPEAISLVYALDILGI